jgi:hypothetical protein
MMKSMADGRFESHRFPSQTFGIPDPDSPAGRWFTWSGVGLPHPDSPAGRFFDWSRMGWPDETVEFGVTQFGAPTGFGVNLGASAHTVTDPEIEALNLSAVAKKAAYELKKKFPSVHFTSGRRDKQEQAHAMATNVVLNRQWIKETYVASAARDACQKWVDENKDKKTVSEIAAGLKKVLDGLSDAQLAHLSKHLSGDAFDVQPVPKDAEAIKKAIRGLPGLDKFLEKEGGLVRWHAQF